MIIRLILYSIVLYLLYTGIKSVILLKRASQTISTADYPTTYIVGNVGRKLTYLVLGDSTAVGVGSSTLEHTYPYQVAKKLADQGHVVSIINIAKAGARVKDVIKNQLPKISEIKPDIISISIGANDATHFTPILSFTNDTKSIISTLTNSGAKTILFASTPNMFEIPALPSLISWFVGERSVKQNDIIKMYIPPNFSYIDIFNEAKLSGLPEYAPDWFHPNDKGYQKWINAFTK